MAWQGKKGFMNLTAGLVFISKHYLALSLSLPFESEEGSERERIFKDAKGGETRKKFSHAMFALLVC